LLQECAQDFTFHAEGLIADVRRQTDEQYWWSGPGGKLVDNIFYKGGYTVEHRSDVTVLVAP